VRHRAVASRLVPRLRRWSARAVARILIRYASTSARSTPEPVPVTLLVSNVFSMGGTIRATLNLAEYLAQHRPVEIVSVFRRRDVPFFALPDGVAVTVLDDRRQGVRRPALAWLLTRRSSVLMHRAERTYPRWSLWTDVRLAHVLRRRRGVLIATRPGLNMLLADIAPPAAARIGQEQLHLRAHRPELRRALAARYPQLDSLVVLTETDRRRYERVVRAPTRLDVIPNSVRRLDGGPADLDAPLVLAAGRFTPQKGYDLLIPAYATIAPRHPDWRLRICGAGPLEQQLEQLVDQHRLRDVVTLAARARNLGVEMARASIFVLSSRVEGFPLVLLEAMSKGMAVVAFDCPTGPSDVIEDGCNGLLVPLGDVNALGAAIARLVDDRPLRHRAAAAAAQTARAFTMDALGPRWDALIDAVAPGVPRRNA
jgi:glycosyltransferase involved in cell wall biosynthesis